MAVNTSKSSEVWYVDSGANSCFMDRNFAQASQISLRKLPCPAFVAVIDGRPIASGNIVEESEPIKLS